jgi:hypothetical protein
MNDTIDHLQQATLRLSQEGSLKERLVDAYAEHLLNIESLHLPELVRVEFDALHAAMHSATPQPRECVIRASVRKMSNAEVRAHAALVVRVFAIVARGDVDPVSLLQQRAPRPAGVAPVVSLFAEA